ncbi:hypothetical protein KRR26_25985 [Corallococcus sp. M34]|uniref:hypothetical protein n=1 Tax=Citreicoccus inhibens TaxID=2849499 RepID=UPI001C24657C|nr:hypothetical protein [Citreicoccus inhibens]MBU8899067.1 hypothetical protein [Citreicoccus inhibens]
MIVFIPVFMYAIFLDDLLRYSLDSQEAALSTVWDFTVQDYTKDLKKAPAKAPVGGSTMIQKQARLMFCDHESGKDRPKEFVTVSSSDPDGDDTVNYKDCADTDHHKAIVAHQCWINPKAKQVTCEAAETGKGNLGVPIHNEYMKKYTTGGIIKCSARLIVENYLLPETLFPQFSEVDKLAKERWHGQGKTIHDNANQGTNDNAYYIKEQGLAILTDTWALTTPADTRPGDKSGEFYERIANIYQNPINIGYPMAALSSATFFSRALSDNLLSPTLLAAMDRNIGGLQADNPLKPNLAIAPQKGAAPTEEITVAGSPTKFFNTEWQDWDKNRTKDSYNKRGSNYMGCKQAEKC